MLSRSVCSGIILLDYNCSSDEILVCDITQQSTKLNGPASLFSSHVTYLAVANVESTYDAFLKYLTRFIQLTSEEVERLKPFLRHRNLRKRQYLLQAGDPCLNENFVIKGCLRAYEIDSSGVEHIAQFAIENWWISDLYSFLTHEPATLNIDALEDSEIVSIEKNDLERLYLEIPKLDRLFRILFQNAFVAHQRRILTKNSQTAEEQYLDFIGKYPNLEQRVPQHQIASYLGLTPETISRIRKQQSKK
jgi:CRP-like cAMP-binding protein